MKSLYRHLSTKQLVVAGLAIPILCTLLIGFLEWQAVNDMLKTRELVRAMRNVQLTLGIFRYSLSDAESCQFRYILTHNDSNVALYHKLMGQVRDDFASLRKMTEASDLQQKQLDTIEPLLKAKEATADQSIAMEQAGNHAGALQIISSEEARKNMLDIESAVETMQAIENQILLVGQNRYQHNFKVSGALSVASMFLSLVCGVGILVLLRRLARLQTAVTLGALTEMLEYEDGTVTIEEYLRRRHKALAAHGQAQIEAERLLSQIERRKSRTTSPQ